MDIGKKDIIWNYSATILRVAAGVLVLPIILKKLNPEDIGLWSIFVTIGSLSFLLDFGFSDSFARNITYIYSGVNKLQKNGFQQINNNNSIDYSLLKGTIIAMKRFYGAMALFLLLLLSTLGFTYIRSILDGYNGDKMRIYISGTIYGLLSIYQLYTLYYDALLRGRGQIKDSKIILVISNLAFIITSSILLIFNTGFISLVFGQLAYVVINRILSKKAFYNADTKTNIDLVEAQSAKKIFKVLLPNATKLGITSIGGYLINRSAIIIGSLYLPLNDIGSYGITKQVIDMLSGLGSVWFSTFTPQIIQFRITNNIDGIRKIIIKSAISLLGVFIVGGGGLLLLSNFILSLLNSKTHFLSPDVMLLFIILALIESIVSISGGILLTKNTVPFFKASIISGVAIVITIFFLLNVLKLGVISLIIAPLIVDLSYQAWKWPIEVIKDIKNNS